MATRPRPALPADRDGVRALLTDNDLPLDGLDQAWLTLVTTDAAGVTGCVALERHVGSGSPVFLLRSLAVRSDRRGTGLGQGLVAAALQAADHNVGASAQVALLTTSAEKYFPRHGFTPTSRALLPDALNSSSQLNGVCSDTAAVYLRT